MFFFFQREILANGFGLNADYPIDDNDPIGKRYVFCRIDEKFGRSENRRVFEDLFIYLYVDFVLYRVVRVNIHQYGILTLLFYYRDARCVLRISRLFREKSNYIDLARLCENLGFLSCGVRDVFK